MNKIYTLLLFLSVSISAFCQESDDTEYTNGVFFLNEDWYGHQNSTINFLSDEGEWTYRVFQKTNPGKELGCTSQFGTIYNGKFYIVSKQERDPGASITGSRLTVCDAKTMVCLKEFQIIAANENGKSIADGRSFLGVSEKKGYIGTSNGIWIYDIENMTIGGQIAGTGNPNGSGYGQLYYAQIGTMVRSDDYVFAIHQQYGLIIIDPDTDKVIKTISAPEYNNNGTTTQSGFGSIVQSKDGNLWISMAANVKGTGATLPYVIKMDPYTFEADTIQIPNDEGIEDIPNSWYAWTADGFCASEQENKIYWAGNNGNSWFKGRRIFSYDIDKKKFSLVYDFEQMPGNWILYGAGFRIHPKTDELYCSLFHEFQDPTYQTVRISNRGELLQEYSMITNYWFPAMPIFPVNPSATSIITPNIMAKHHIYTLGNTLYIKNFRDYRFSLYNISGVKMKEMNVTNDDYSKALYVDKGIYILCGIKGADIVSRKIIIK
ncbi:DUF5074 domain-containing protein [Massilibacteroides vaginae]|uniref:DUF5074 domain-containing protein n=1 Tax=Massilibacteroides vaginae TaxID=1673718 RepID=UPI000A1CA48A|nr:DUF5074 domain-containing protein [Massilibacteroides vaginae]